MLSEISQKEKDKYCTITSIVEFFFSFFFFLFLLWPHLWHMEVPGLGVELELQLQVYTTDIATPNLSLICDFYAPVCGNARILTR